MSLSQSLTGAKASNALVNALHEHWKALVVEGVLLCVLGAGAVALPFFAGLAAAIFLGWLFIMVGIVGLLAAFRTRAAPGFGWSILSAIAALIAGGVLLWNPLLSLATLTYVLMAFFVFDGLLMIAIAIAHRRALAGKWEWLALNGLIDLFIAGVIFVGLPGALVWALGLLVGIDLIFGGVALIAMGLDARASSSPAVHV